MFLNHSPCKIKNDGHFPKFAPADVWTPEELQKNKPEGFTETDCIQTSTGKFFQKDGWVMYSTENGICL